VTEGRSTLPRVRIRRAPRPAPTYHRREIEAGEVFVAYHLVKIGDQGDEAFADGFRSRAELGHPPRDWIGENAELAAGISAYKTRQAAADTALTAARRGRDLGAYVAEIELSEGQGFEIAEHGAHGHLTIWGDALMLALHVTDIVPVAPAEDTE
jgi:hypothetical protein